MRFRPALAALFFSVLALPAFGQTVNVTFGGVNGRVTDSTGGILPGATVTVTNLDTGLTRSVETDNQGAYTFSLLPPGRYRVEAELSGLGKSSAVTVDVLLGNSTKADLKIAPQVSETVTVTAETPIVDTSRTGQATTITNLQIENLPLLGRDFRSLASLTPGIVDAFGGRITSNGARGIATDYNIDGATSNNDFFGENTGGTRAPFTFSQAAIREFQVVRSQYDAEYGRGVGAQLNAITKSGTNELAGEAFLFWRDKNWVKDRSLTLDNGETVVDSYKAKDSKQPGFAVGGPIVRNKAFFFGNFDGQRQKLPVISNDIRTSTQFQALSPALQQQFLDKVAGLVGHPWDGELNYDTTFNQQTYLGKVDFNLSGNHRLSVRDNYTNFENGNNQSAAYLSNQGTEHDKFNQLVAQETAVLSNRLLNETLVQFSSDQRPIDPVFRGAEVQISGVTSGTLFLGGNDFLPNNTKERKIQIKDTVQYVTGHHHLKVGTELLFMHIDNLFPRNLNGVFLYNSAQAFVDGTPNSYRQGYGPGGGLTTWTQNTYAFYAGDNFTVGPRLTVDLGLRYDWQTMPTPDTNVYTQHPEFIDDIKEDRNNLAPRLGFAYDVTGDGRSVVRGGTGLFYGYMPDILLSNPLTQISGNFSQFTLTCASSPVPCPAFPNVLTAAQLDQLSAAGVTSIVTISPDYGAQQSWRSSAQYQMRLGSGYSAAVSGTYATMTHIQGSRDLNAVPSGTVLGDLPVYALNTAGRPYTDLNVVRELCSCEEASYKSLVFETHRLATAGSKYTWDLSYTLAKAVDQDSNERSTSTSFLFDPNNPKLSAGPSDNDVRHRVVGDFTYELPYGFMVSAIVQIRSGAPYNGGISFTGVGIPGSPNSLNGLSQQTGNIPVFVDSSGAVIDLTQANGFTRQQFADWLAGQGAHIIGRNAYRQPGWHTVDFRVAKSFDLTGGTRVQLVAEVFNVFNTVNEFVSSGNQNAFRATYTQSTGQVHVHQVRRFRQDQRLRVRLGPGADAGRPQVHLLRRRGARGRRGGSSPAAPFLSYTGPASRRTRHDRSPPARRLRRPAHRIRAPCPARRRRDRHAPAAVADRERHRDRIRLCQQHLGRRAFGRGRPAAHQLPGADHEPALLARRKVDRVQRRVPGNMDVYVIPAAGGEPRRLTWHPGADQVTGWTPDDTAIVFSSTRATVAPSGAPRFWTVPVAGGVERPMVLPRAYQGKISPDGRHIAYRMNNSWDEERRNYRGGQNRPVWIVDLTTYGLVSPPWTDSKDVDPVWLSNSTVAFISDRDGVANVWSYDTASKKLAQLTKFRDFDVKTLDSGAGALVFEQAGYVHELDPTSGREHVVAITAAGDFPWMMPRWEDVTSRMTRLALSPTGKRIAVEARGEVFTIPAEKGDIRNLSHSSGSADRDPAWSPDGKYVSYFSDRSGEYQLIVEAQDGLTPPRAIALPRPTHYYTPSWSPDSKKIVYTDTNLHVWVLEVATGETKTVGRDPWMVPQRTLNPVWSPDSTWIAYSSRLQSLYHAIFATNVDTGETVQVTDGLSDAVWPAWDAGGKYLWFLASTDFGLASQWLDMTSYDHAENFGLYLAVLARDEPSPLLPESDEDPGVGNAPRSPAPGGGGSGRGARAGGDAGAAGSAGDAGNEPAQAGTRTTPRQPVTVRIDADRLAQRILAIPGVPVREYSDLRAGVAGTVFYRETGGGGGATLVRYRLSDRRASTFMAGVSAYDVSADGRKLVYRTGAGGGRGGRGGGAPATVSLFLVDADRNPPPSGQGRVDVRLRMYLEPRAEFTQIFNEGWRNQRDYLYVPNMHGTNWDDDRGMYAQLLPYVNHRADLNYLLDMMGAEISIGHSYVRGGDMPDVPSAEPCGLLGADFVIEGGRYKVTRIYDTESWNPDLRAPLAGPGIDVNVGDFVLAINGAELQAPDNIFRLLDGTASRQTVLTVGPRPAMDGTRQVTVVPVSSEQALRTRAWVEDNRRIVERLSDGKLAYVYLPNTGQGGYQSFNRYYFAQQDKQGAIVDERFNGGGSAADYIVDVLERQFDGYFNNVAGDRYPFTSPAAGIWGPKVMIINEMAGSGGDLMPYMFRSRKIGPLVGKRTWGGLVHTADTPGFIDGGSMIAPRGGFFARDGKWAVENEGVAPDIDVENWPKDVIAGHDVQLERAVAEALKLLEEHPVNRLSKEPPPPTWGKRTGGGGGGGRQK